ncbi:hypothetical protein BOSP111201_24160 [Bordetella sputigena]|uniref:hypothetical protein n=1 Tax=Bordetella sputigena TaxID=1416810 RepID=UPI0039F0FD94
MSPPVSAAVTAAINVPPSPGFLPAFFDRHTPPQASVAAPGADGKPRISYCADRDGSYAEFCNGKGFTRFRDEMRENIDFLIARARQLGMQDSDVVAQRLLTFYRHRFEDSYFDTHAELIDSRGKEALDHFCAMLADPRIAPDKQRTAIRNLSQGVAVCASGTVRNLIDADRDLALAVGGIRGRLWKTKEEMVRALLQAAVVATYAPTAAMEIHYVNVVWNELADDFGLVAVPESTKPGRITQGFVDDCRARVHAALSPDKVARTLAENCLEDFRARTVSDGASAIPCDSDHTEWLNIVVRDIQRGLDLTEDQLSLHAFVRIDQDNERFEVLEDPSLIAVGLLKAMNADHLLAGVPSYVTELDLGDGEHFTLYACGSTVAWLRRHAAAASAAGSWETHEDLAVIGMQGLRAWSAALGADHVDPPAAVVRQLANCTDPEQLMGVRASWLGTAAAILDLLTRLGPERASEYLAANMDYLVARLPVRERAAFVDKAMLMGKPGQSLACAWYSELWLLQHLPPAQAVEYLEENLSALIARVELEKRPVWVDAVIHMGKAGAALVRNWYIDPWALLTERDAGRQRTHLQRWIETGNVAAIDAMRVLVGGIWPVKTDPDALEGAVDQAFRDFDGHSVLYGLPTADANTIDAIHRLLEQLLSQPGEIREALASRLPALFQHAVYRSFLSLLHARDAPVIEAIHRIIRDPAILPHISHVLPSLFFNEHTHYVYPMWVLLIFGDAERLRAYGRLIIDLAAVPGMEKCLGRMMATIFDTRSVSRPARPDKRTFDRYALLSACEQGFVDAIDAYRDVLVHPAVLPHMAGILPQLVAEVPQKTWRWSAHRREALNRLFDPRCPGHAAYRRLVTHPLVLPHAAKALPSSARALRGWLAKPQPRSEPPRLSLRDQIEPFLRRLGI